MINIPSNDELKATLRERGVTFDDNATNAELAKLVSDNPASSTNDGDDTPGSLPSASLEQGAAASTFEANPDAPEGSIAQIEKLPDEQ